MNASHTIVFAILGVSAALALAQPQSVPTPAAPAQASTPAPKERIAEVKKSFAQSQAALRSYEWVETTVTTLKGDEKGRTEKRCYFAAEGGVQKVVISAPEPEKAGRGIRGKIKEQKKEELSEYMQEAAALVHKYVPPDAEKLQKCADAGKASIQVLEPGKRAALTFRDYLQVGDALTIEIDLVGNTILGLSVATTMTPDKDAVTLAVRFSKFPDGTIYTAESILDAKAKQVAITVTNSGYRKTAGASK